MQDGTLVQKQVLANEYILGHAPLDLYANESKILNEHIYPKSSSTNDPSWMTDEFGLVSPIFKAGNECLFSSFFLLIRNSSFTKRLIIKKYQH